MSHLTKIELEINDLSALRKSCERLDLSFMLDQKQFVWYGREPAKCDHAIKIPNARYEIGVIKKDNKFELSVDWYDREISKAVGHQGGLLKQAYAIEKGKIEARKKGYQVFEQQTDAGIQLRIRLPH